MHSAWLKLGALLILGFGLGLRGQESPAELAGSRQGRHQLLHMVYDGGSFSIRKRTIVNGSMPKAREVHAHHWRVQLVNPDGGLAYEGGLQDPTILRGEFRNELAPDKIDAFFVKQPGPVSFMLRVPYTSATHLDFYERGPQDTCDLAVPTRQLRKLGHADLMEKE